MPNQRYSAFIKNSKFLVGTTGMTMGLFLATSGIFEYYTSQKLLKDSSLKSINPVGQIIKEIDNLPIGQKTGFASPLIWFGALLAYSAADNKNKSKIGIMP